MVSSIVISNTDHWWQICWAVQLNDCVVQMLGALCQTNSTQDYGLNICYHLEHFWCVSETHEFSSSIQLVNYCTLFMMWRKSQYMVKYGRSASEKMDPIQPTVFLTVVQSIGSISPVCKYLNFPVKLWRKWADSELFDMSKRTCFLFWETANLFLITFSKNPQSEADTSMWNFSPYGRVWWN